MSPQRVPCDQCRQRRVRCDGDTPCARCQQGRLTCRREYIPKRRGPKFGSGKRIAALRVAQQSAKAQCGTTTVPKDQRQPTSRSIATDPLEHSEPEGEASASVRDNEHGFTCPDALLSGSELSESSLLHLIKRCIDIYLQKMYPIMPIFNPPELHQMLERQLEANERSMLLALSALVTTFMCRRSESVFGGVEWEPVAQYFLSESLAMRAQYDYIQDSSLFTLLASFFLSVAYFELHNTRLCWFYLREAITFAQALGLHTEGFYHGLDRLEALYCRRVYDILFITERSFAISRYKPALLSQAMPLPADAPEEEQTEIDIGFRQLVRVYSHLDMSFIENWSQPGSGLSTSSSPCQPLKSHPVLTSQDCDLASDTQKADIAITEHWLRLVFWRSALQRGLLSNNAGSRFMTFSYPEDIALSLLQTMSSLPSESVEVHGLGIFEKVFEVGTALADVIHCSAKVTGPTLRVSQNLDRLRSIVQHLYLTPNSRLKYAKTLEPRVFECFLSYGNSVVPNLELDLSRDGRDIETADETTLEKCINDNSSL